MLESFYNYVAKELIFGYFRSHPVEKGSRFFMLIENDEYRDGLLNAIYQLAEPITLSGLYKGIDSSIEEDTYHTYVLKPSHEPVGIIIGYDRTATEDYLTTIRNNVGVKGSKYENYAVLFILTNNSSSILSSINTTVSDLQDVGYPLNARYIIDDINKQAENKITQSLERKYLKKHLYKISSYIEDGTCTLFDFQFALSALEDKKLKGHFNDMDFFNDKSIYDPRYTPSDAEFSSRVDRNHYYYRLVSDIMNEDDDADKLKMLEKYFDEKLSLQMFKQRNGEWKQIDFQTIQDSLDKKASTAKLELEDISMPEEGLLTGMVKNTQGNLKKKTKNFIIICDESGATEIKVKARFNKNLDRKPSTENCKISGSTATFIVKDDMIMQSIGLNDNHHDFLIMRLHCNKSFFKDIQGCFSFNKKGEVSVVVPDEATELTFGDGSDNVNFYPDFKHEWNDNAIMKIPVATDDDTEKINFSVVFDGKEVKFTLKLNIATPQPPALPGTVIGTYEGNGTIVVSTSDGEFVERKARNFWAKYLDWEKLFVDEGCAYIAIEYNDATHNYEPHPKLLALPDNVTNQLLKIFEYYKEKETVPSLRKMDDELHALYSGYWKEVSSCIQSIPNGRNMTREEYDLTRLGVVEDGDKIYLSPFHPINIAYALEYDAQYDTKEDSSFAKKLLSPFYLLPYIYYKGKAMKPYSDNEFKTVLNWLCFEGADSAPQEHINNITTRMVCEKMEAFILHFKYLFQDKDCPIIISTVGISDDTNVIMGIIDFIKKQYAKGVQRIELHEYVTNLMKETFFERINRLNSTDAIIREFEYNNENIESKGDYTSQEIIHQLFTRVTFFKHDIRQCDYQIGYSHIAFYLMNTGTKFVTPLASNLRVELSFNGLISIPSTLNKDGSYLIGYGTKGVDEMSGYIYPMASLMNMLYANEKNECDSVFSRNICLANKFAFEDDKLLQSIYDNANWVTFINPEVDINFFYKQNLYIVHYTDQYTINAKYDSITVTKHIDQYENMLRKSYEQYALSEENFQHFNVTMMNYFNCLNGSWMLKVVNKTDVKIREKMSIVATCIAMSQFMERNKNVYWVPVSLEEILRVTHSIGLPENYIFTKKSLGAKGSMSDDLLMIGLDVTDSKNLKLYLYPVEVKCSENCSMSAKACEQVCHTYVQLYEHLFGEKNFTKNIYRTFFASQFLTNAEKLNANALMSDEVYGEIDRHRFDLLNLRYTLEKQLPVREMGVAAVVSFYSQTPHDMHTSLVNNIPVCEIHFPLKDCFQSVAEPHSDILNFLREETINCDDEASKPVDEEALHAKNDMESEEITIKNLFDINYEDNVDSEMSIAADGLEQESEKAEEIKEEEANEEEVKVKEIRPLELKERPIRIVVGHTITSKSEVVFEPNNTKMVSHPNMGIIGTMGTGKTQFARSLIAQFSKESAHNLGGKPIGMLVFDYKGDYKDKEFLDAVGGECYKYNFPFNPLKLVVNEEIDGINLPAITADRISDSFAKAYGLGLKQQSNIKQVIIETYADAGITKDPATWSRQTPTMEQVINKYFETCDANDKAFALFDKLRDYTIFTSDNSCCVSLFEWLNKVRVIDLTLYPDDTKKVIVSLILDLFYAEMRQLGGSKQEDGLRELRAMIMVDEAHQFLKKDFNSFRNIISEGRMFGVGMILSTQNVSDFKTAKEDYSQFVLSWMIHHVNSVSKSEMASIFGASDINIDKYMKFINDAKIFESICKIGNRVEGIRDLPFFELVKQDDRFKTE